MTQFSTGELDVNERRRRFNIGPERTGITESLSAPGITPVGPNVSNTLAEFDRAIGLAGQLASAAGRFAERQRFLDARTQAAQDQVDKGLAYVDVSTDLAADAERINEMDLDFFGELNQAGKSIEEHADDVFRHRTEGMSDAYRERYLQTFKPRYVAGLISRRSALQEEARTQTLAKLGDALAGSVHSKTEINAVLESMKAIDPDIDVLEQKAPLVDIGLEQARRGNSEDVNNILDVLGPDFKNEQSRIERTLTAALTQHQAKREQQTYDMLQALIVAGMPEEMVRNRIEVHRDRFTTDLPAENLLAQLDNREAGSIRQEQAGHLNNLRIVVGNAKRFGALPEGGREAIVNRVFEGMTQPGNSPTHIKAADGFSMIDDLADGMRFNAHMKQVGEAFGGTRDLPLSASHDSAIDQMLAGIGVIKATPTENGTALIDSFEDPQAYALASDKFGRISNNARALIAAGLEGDQPEAVKAAQVYSALFDQNPALAAQAQQGMTPLAKARARFVEANRWRSNTPWELQEFMRIKPVEIDQDVLRGRLWLGDDAERPFQGEVQAAAREQLQKAMSEIGAKQDSWFYRNIATNVPFVRFAIDDSTEFAPIRDKHASKYAAILEDEYRTALAITATDEAALERAQQFAQIRFVAENSPVKWGSGIHLTDSNLPFDPDFEARIVGDLRDRGIREDVIKELLDDFTPLWNAQERAWHFENQIGQLRTVPREGTVGGVILTVDPYAPGEINDIDAWLQENKRKARELIEAKDKPEETPKKRKHGLDAFLDEDGELIPGIP